MPIFEYECQDCGERFEQLVRMLTRPEEVECPK
ncbi:MAG TPA: FmdB family zinc ribbon protein [Anaerolineae bacterium]